MEPIPDIFFSTSTECAKELQNSKQSAWFATHVVTIAIFQLTWHTVLYDAHVHTVLCCLYCTVLSVYRSVQSVLYSTLLSILYTVLQSILYILLCPYCSVQFRTVLYFTVRTELWCPNCTVPFILYCAVRSVCTLSILLYILSALYSTDRTVIYTVLSVINCYHLRNIFFWSPGLEKL